MKKVKLESSLLKAAKYKRKSKTLVLTFVSGRVYEYEDVPEETYQELINADSVGRYFNSQIKYSFTGWRVD